MVPRNTVNGRDSHKATARLIDAALILVVLLIGGFSLSAAISSGVFSNALFTDRTLVWHLVRSSGMIAFTLLTASTLWGIFLSLRLLRHWSPGPLAMLMHATTSWLAVILSAGHALLLLLDKFNSYKLIDILIPFTGPYRPFAVGLGIIAFWLVLVITLSFSVRRLMSRRSWLLLHYTSYGAFGLVALHSLLAGTDASMAGVRLILIGFAVGVAVMLVWRVSRALAAQTTASATRGTKA